MTKTYRFLILDLDGTLVDSLRDITGAVNHARAALGRPALSETTVRGFVGGGAEILIARSFPPAERARALELFKAHYHEHLLDHTRPYPGIPETLAAAHGAGVRSAVLTNKPDAYAVRLVEALGLAPCLAAVLGGDRFRKPAPEAFQAALAVLGADASSTLVVGDGRPDLEGARGAGLASCAVLYGLGSAEELLTLSPNYTLKQPYDLLSIIGL